MELLLPVVITVVGVAAVIGALSYLLDKGVTRHERGGDS